MKLINDLTNLRNKYTQYPIINESDYNIDLFK